MKKFMSLTLAIALSTSLFAGCGSSSPAPAAPAAPAAETPAGADPAPAPAEGAGNAVMLTTVSMFGGNDPAASAYSDLISGFEAATGHTVDDASDAANEDWKAQVVTDFNTGNEPDVIFYFNGGDGAPILDKVVPYDTIKAAYPDYAQDINEGPLTSMREADGTLYAVPVKGFFEGLFVNQDLFEEYSLDLPTDWDKFTKAIETFNANGITPISFGFAEEPHYLIESLILVAGGVAEHSVAPTTDPATVPASWALGLNTFKTLANLNAFPVDAATRKEQTVRQDFVDKKAAMMVGGSWATGSIIEGGRGDNVVVMPLPVMPGGKGTGNEIVAGFSSGFYITQKAWNNPEVQKAAVDFVNHMTSKESVSALMAGGAGSPAAVINADPNAPLVVRTGNEMAGKAASDMPVDSRLKKSAWTEIWMNAVEIAEGNTTGEEVIAKAIPQNKD